MAKTPRQVKTPQQRAEETLEAAQRAVARAEKRVTATYEAWTAARSDLAAARSRQTYAAADPALQPEPEPDLAEEPGEGVEDYVDEQSGQLR
jgi:hypothetical protein